MFPPLSGVQNQPSTHQEFSTFAFWREPILDIRLAKAMAEDSAGAANSNPNDAAGSEACTAPLPALAEVVDAAVTKDNEQRSRAASAAPDGVKGKS